MNIIETKGLTKYYGKSRGIIDLDLSVSQGEIFGFIGPNGAGKSTTIRLLLGLISPSSGTAKVLNMDCGRERTSILAQIGYMPSEAMFYDSLRVKEMIQLSAKLHKKDCSREAALLCDRFMLDKEKKIRELSLGNRKKVGIVCAFQHRPQLYILDEPTSGLDPLMQKEFFSLVEERNKEGAAVFLSSHVLSEIQRHCHSAAIIRDGQLVVHGSVEALSKTSARKVEVHGIQTPPAIDGILDVDCGAESVRFLYQGEMKSLIASLNALPVQDLSISEPDIEEIFMHFYNERGGANDFI